MPRSRYATAAAVRSAYSANGPAPLFPAKVAIGQFSYDATARSFTGEVSETAGFGRVWADSADEGLTIVGTTGRPVVFVVEAEERDADGDVTLWRLRSLVGGFTLTLFND